MNVMRIRKLSINNFKLFDNLQLDFAKTLTILGGRNGYGKTSIFDALDLLFTGKIKRYEDYGNQRDKRQSFDEQTERPLLHTMKQMNLTIEAEIESEEKCFKLRRVTSIDRVHNPLKFDEFGHLEIQNSDSDKWHTLNEGAGISDNPLHDLNKRYSLFHYLSQEQALDLVSRDEKNRKKAIADLLDTTQFDHDLANIERAKKALKKLQDKLEIEKSKQRQKVDELGAHAQTEKVEYIRLCDKVPAEWETPEPESALCEEWLREGGVIDDLLFYVERKALYFKLLRNNKIDSILNNGYQLLCMAFAVFYADSLPKFKSYSYYHKNIVPRLSVSKADDLHLLLEMLQNFEFTLNDSVRRELQELSERYRHSENFLNDQAKNLTLLQSQREAMAKILNSSHNSSEARTQCPLCGTEFETLETLNKSIVLMGEKLKSQQDNEGREHEKLQNIIVGLLAENVSKPLDKEFAALGFTPDLIERFGDVDLAAVQHQIKALEDELAIKFNKGNSLEETMSGATALLRKERCDLTAISEDWQRLDRIHTQYGRFLAADIGTSELEQRRRYMHYYWGQLCNVRLKEEMKRLAKLDDDLSKCSEFSKKVAHLLGNVNQQKKEYESKLITDIKTLFYIYSGRIMQNGGGSSGIYLNYDTKKDRIIMSVGRPDSEVDALYKLSSGQLAAVALSLMLSLHKLYAKTSFLAIDDPLQTLDDLNFWGLIETLRHEFGGEQLIMSTHEDEYAALLNYKFKKLGLSTKYIDMMELGDKK